MRSSSKPSTERAHAPVRRVVAVDAGSRRLKFAYVRNHFGQPEILREESVDLHEEGVVTPEELKSHLQEFLKGCGQPAVALTLAQHLSTSQTVELQQAPPGEVHKLIEGEIVKLSGVSDSAIVHDFVEVRSPAPNRQQFWVTLCKERDIEERVRQLGVEQEDLCEVTTAANALAAAYRAAEPKVSEALLVYLGAQSTMLVGLSQGQTVFAASFPVGGDSFTRSLVKARHCTIEEAESLKRSTDVLNGDGAVREFVDYVDGWVAELKRQFNDWSSHRAGAPTTLSAFTVVATGNAFQQPGLLDYLKTRAGLIVQPWPARPGLPSRGFEIAYGTALQALGLAAQPVSLLPAERRAAWKRRVTTQKIELANAALLILCFVALAFAVWQKISLIQNKQVLLTKVQAGMDSLQGNQALTAELLTQYETIRPLLERQQNTSDTVAALALLQQTYVEEKFWYVLLADQQSYFNSPVGVSTNQPMRTNTFNTYFGPILPSDLDHFGLPLTNISPAKPGLIVELCVPEKLEAARRVLSQIVNELKQRPLFAKVDSLSDDLRRDLADPKVVLADRHFALFLDFAGTEFHQPVLRRPRPESQGSSRSGRRSNDDGDAFKSSVMP